MPNYEFLCNKCGQINENFSSYEQRPKSIICICGGKAEYIISAGQKPIISANTPEEKFQKSKTIGEFWDRQGISPNNPKHKKAAILKNQALKRKNKKNNVKS